MRTASVEADLNLSKDKLWELFTNISNYPKYIKFVQKTELKGNELVPGAIWYDWTTILFVPMKIKHIVVLVKSQSEIGFDVPMVFGSLMQQRFSFFGDSNKTMVKGKISFDFKNGLLDKILGPILQKRLQEMLEGSLENFRKVHNV